MSAVRTLCWEIDHILKKISIQVLNTVCKDELDHNSQPISDYFNGFGRVEFQGHAPETFLNNAKDLTSLLSALFWEQPRPYSPFRP